eukprot:jgi/Hompol1/3489/HPOL_003258-RA
MASSKQDDFDIETYLRTEANEFTKSEEVERIMGIFRAASGGRSGAVASFSAEKPPKEDTDAAGDDQEGAGAGAGGSAASAGGKVTLDPVAVLGLAGHEYVTCELSERSIKQQYRRRSLLVHPDKCHHKDAAAAFELLAQAQIALLRPALRRPLLALLRDARAAAFTRARPPLPVPKLLPRPDSDPAAVPAPTFDPLNPPEPPEPLYEPVDAAAIIARYPSIVAEIQATVRQMLFDVLNRDRIRLKNEKERKLAEAERELAERRRKMDHNKLWEETRESRVDNWRKFSSGKTSKKKKKEDELPGALPPEIARQLAQQAASAGSRPK